MKTVVNILNFGAQCDGTIQTAPIQAAIDHCFLQGGGEVQVPAGTFVIGSIRIRSGVALHLLENAVLKGTRDPEDYFSYLEDGIEPLRHDQVTNAPYIHVSTIKGETAYDPDDLRYRYRRLPASRWNNALIRAIDAENVAILGEKGSVIDGSNCFDEQGEELYRGPHAITFHNTRNITLRGYTVRDSANWAHNMLFCENILMEDVEVLAGHDGFDAFTSSNIVIRNCRFYTGDDCIAGFGNRNVLIADCILNSSCSGMRYSGTNTVVRNCRFYGPGKYLFRGSLTAEEKRLGDAVPGTGHRFNMLSAFCFYGDYSMPIPEQPGNILIADCTFENVDRFIHYHYFNNNRECFQNHRPLANITFADVQATGIGMPLTVCAPEHPKVDFTLRRCTIALREDAEPMPLMRTENFRRIELDDVTVEGLKADHLILARTDGDFIFRNVICPLDEEQYVRKTDEEFVIHEI
ncbi:MAG: glycoside hydrolase family 28 protein [Christensenellales bacterium]|jgi:hypothetical protein